MKQFGELGGLSPSDLDPCRLVRQVKQFHGYNAAGELLHLPDKPAGVGIIMRRILAAELLHLPDKPAGVRQPVRNPG